MRGLGRSLAADEGGFTLAEVLVTSMLMVLALLALYSVFDMSLRVFGFGNDKTEAAENARLGLERMEREIRAAYPQDKAGASGTVNEALVTSSITNPAAQITFGNDRNGNRVVDAGEVITYRRDAGDPTTLVRVNNGTAQPVVEFVSGLSFEFLDQYGTATTTEANVRLVRISLTTRVNRSLAAPVTQTLSTDVALRNRTN